MASIDNIVQVTISRQTQTVQRKAFGWAMILSVHTRFSERVRWYSQASWSVGMLADGFLTTDAAYIAAQSYFGQSPSPSQVAIGRRTNIEDADTALAACLAYDGDWYGLILTDRTAAQVLKAAAWIESNSRIFVNSSWDTNIINQALSADVTSLAYAFKAAAYKRSSVEYSAGGSPLGSLYPEAAWIGGCFPYDPGTVNWAHKQLAGITVDRLTDTQRTNAHAKFCSTYETIGGVNVTEEGWTGNGDFLDSTQAIDWLQASLQEAVWQVLAQLPKVPFTDAGIATIQAACYGVFKKATDNGVLAPYDPKQGDFFAMPAAADCSAGDKAARTLNAPKCFQRRLSGALNHVVIQGNITL